jgi:hypothetical protein
MGMTPEGKVKAAVKKYLKERAVWYCMPMGTGFGSSGVPDFLCCKNGLFIAIETKAPGKRGNTSVLQRQQIDSIHLAGGIAVVIDDVEQLRGIV